MYKFLYNKLKVYKNIYSSLQLKKMTPQTVYGGCYIFVIILHNTYRRCFSVFFKSASLSIMKKYIENNTPPKRVTPSVFLKLQPFQNIFYKLNNTI